MPDEYSRPRANPFEIALWVLCPVLIVGSSWAFMTVMTQQLTGTTSDNSFQSITQFVYVTTPGLVTGGVLCGVAALVLRAFEFNARRRISAVDESTPAIEQDAVAESARQSARESATQPTPASARVPAPGDAVRTSRFARADAPLDTSIFMRPRD